mgnify:CR=1 FL=1|tara:strand:- start:2343 stop:2648 length:306 start_codon:yes stop_codon:yes gene_type:complete
MFNILYVIFILLWIILFCLELNRQIKKDCKKDTLDCNNKKKKIIGISLIILGIAIAAPGFSWVPAGLIAKKYGKKLGEKVLIFTIVIGIILSIIGTLLYFN